MRLRPRPRNAGGVLSTEYLLLLLLLLLHRGGRRWERRRRRRRGAPLIGNKMIGSSLAPISHPPSTDGGRGRDILPGRREVRLPEILPGIPAKPHQAMLFLARPRLSGGCQPDSWVLGVAPPPLSPSPRWLGSLWLPPLLGKARVSIPHVRAQPPAPQQLTTGPALLLYLSPPSAAHRAGALSVERACCWLCSHVKRATSCCVVGSVGFGVSVRISSDLPRGEGGLMNLVPARFSSESSGTRQASAFRWIRV